MFAQSIQNKCNYYNTGWLTTYIYIDIHKEKSVVDREEDADDSAWLAAPKRKGDPRFGIESSIRGTMTYDLQVMHSLVGEGSAEHLDDSVLCVDLVELSWEIICE